MELISVSSKVPGTDLLSWLSAQNADSKVYLKLRDHGWSVAGFGNLLESPKSPLPFESWTLEDYEDFFNSEEDQDLKLFVGAPYFLRNESIKFQIPRFEFVQDGADYTLTARRWKTESPDDFKGQINLQISEVKKKDISIIRTEQHPKFETWAKIVRLAQSDALLKKVVLARVTDIEISETKQLPYYLLKKLNVDTYKSLFQWDNETQWISASPERLFRIEGGALYTEALAGTRPRGKNHEEDLLLEKELLGSKKEGFEHDLVVKDIAEKLRRLSLNPNFTKTSIRKLSKVQHLVTQVDAELYDTGFSDLIRNLHPTAALGGTPTDSALCFLQKHEPIQREYYGGPFGVVTKHFSEFFVNIRSAQTNDNHIRLFSGCGIVDESDPKKEWDELDAKTAQYMELLK